MGWESTIGSRLITSLVDYYAEQEPKKVWASVPKGDVVSDGFVDITYEQFANAVNHASWWLESQLGVSEGHFETFAYAGPKDLSYPILAVAASKAGRTILLPSPFTTDQAQIHLLKVTRSKVYLYTESNREAVEPILESHPDTKPVIVPDAQEWLFGEKALTYRYNKSWEEAKTDPWIIFHTSGTTGLPKPITYTNLMMTSLDATLTMPEAKLELQTHHYMNARWYTPLPALHFVGMTTMLQMTVLLGTVLVLGPVGQPTTPAAADQVIRHGNVVGTILPPSLLEAMCSHPDMLKSVRSLKYVHWAGAPLAHATGVALCQHVKLVSALGSTESGPYFVRIHDKDEWQYHDFCPSIGLEFEPRTDRLYEAVFRKKSGLERWQQIFLVNPSNTEFYTNDLMARHPKNPNLWKFVGRQDDHILLSHGSGLWASDMESIITNHPGVQGAIIGGQGRAKPFLILDIAEDRRKAVAGASDKDLIDRIWPAVEQANQQCLEHVRLSKELSMLTLHSKPFVRTAKGTIARASCLDLYRDEIDALYNLGY